MGGQGTEKHSKAAPLRYKEVNFLRGRKKR